jgi:hypothetical protein
MMLDGWYKIKGNGKKVGEHFNKNKCVINVFKCAMCGDKVKIYSTEVFDTDALDCDCGFFLARVYGDDTD